MKLISYSVILAFCFAIIFEIKIHANNVLTGGPYYYEDFKKYKIPFEPRNQLTEEEAKKRISYAIVYFNKLGKVNTYTKYLRGNIMFKDEYFYFEKNASLGCRKIVNDNNEYLIQWYNENGKLIKERQGVIGDKCEIVCSIINTKEDLIQLANKDCDTVDYSKKSNFLIQLYYSNGDWIYDDINTGETKKLVLEGYNFVEEIAKTIPESKNGFYLIFSKNMSDDSKVIYRQPDKKNDRWYLLSDGNEKNFCLSLYFSDPPQKLFFKTAPIKVK